MNEKPSVSTRLADAQGAAAVETHHVTMTGSKSVLKPPHFAISPAKMWTAFLYRWKLALFVGVLFACIGAAVGFFTYKPKYVAMASMRLNASKPRVLPGAGYEDAANRELDFQRIQTQLVKSRDVLRSVVSKDEIRGLASIRNVPDPVAWLEKETQATFIGGTDIFRIWLSGENPEDIALIVNVIADVYVDQFANYSDKQQSNRSNTIDKALGVAQEKVRKHAERLKQLADSFKTGDKQALTLRQKMALDEFGTLRRELITLESEIRRTTSLRKVLQADLTTLESEKIPQATIEEFLTAEPPIKKELSEINRIEQQIKEIGKTATPMSGLLRRPEEELKAAQARLQKLKLEAQPDVIEKARAFLTQQKKLQIAQAEEKLKIHFEQHRVVAEQAEQLGREADKIGVGQFDIEMRRGEMEEAQVTLKKLRAEKEHIEIEKSNTGEAVHSKNQADVPTINQASLPKNIAIWSIGGLVLGLLGVSYLEARLHRLHKSTEVHQELGLQTLGILPLLEQTADQAYGKPLGIERSLSSILFSEAINSLCARLLCDDRLPASAVVMVTSAAENEGKTMLATQLAIGMAHAGRKTLLLDCDFRKPQCHAKLGLAAGPGLCQLLNGSIELKEALQPVPDSDAGLITVGRHDPMLVRSLNNGSFAALLARLREQFDFIIIDTAPTLIVADGFLIGKLVDGVIMMIRSAYSKGPDVFAAYEQLSALKIPILGAVVNGNRGSLTRPYYYRKESLETAKAPEASEHTQD